MCWSLQNFTKLYDEMDTTSVSYHDAALCHGTESVLTHAGECFCMVSIFSLAIVYDTPLDDESQLTDRTTDPTHRHSFQ